jgi:hypothetical protein
MGHFEIDFFTSFLWDREFASVGDRFDRVEGKEVWVVGDWVFAI